MSERPVQPGEQMEGLEHVIERLADIHPNATFDLLNERASKVDPSVGIVVVKLDVPPMKTEKGEYHFYAARVFPEGSGRQNFVTPHYHESGEEPYYFQRGEGGIMYRGRVIDGEVVWERKDAVEPKMCVVAGEGQVHCLRNPNESNDIDFVFACPERHLVDHNAQHPEGDRYIVRDLPGGIPDWGA